ncbi:hypothetical protein J4573_52030 [Actinomadura barringtoniae]|uniref:Uncharacterized protein n=1 Tax=Actinomadura barringtoniae TaxID=1427535 RepID=A0A939PVP3_9ACTN|nr:hypothetical protein [Actinomadura barringtoniae]MBO2455686.1 hypothetical protein [Actinomadura barringtoniae]
MNRDEVDRALQDLRDEKERISTALLDLESHQGFRLLEGAAVTGETARRQGELQSRTTSLWGLFDLYGGTLAAAEELRARHSKPGQAQLAELTHLLTGPSVELPAVEVPLERRTLLSAPGGEKLSLRAVVARMTPLFEEAAKMAAAVDVVWSELLNALAEVDQERRAVTGLAQELGATGPATDPEAERVFRDVDALSQAVRTDPMSFGRGGHADTTRLRTARKDLADLRRRLAEAGSFRADAASRIERVAASIDQVRAAEAEARHARDQVLIKIASPALPDLRDLSPALADRLGALHVLRDARRWGELADRVADLEQAVATALQRARGDASLITGLLDRREELRGRLGAYKMKAARLGLAEDAELTRLYSEARDLLWTSPCDLRKATATLSDYQRVISSKGSDR